jgi:hypothetical protein
VIGHIDGVGRDALVRVLEECVGRPVEVTVASPCVRHTGRGLFARVAKAGDWLNGLGAAVRLAVRCPAVSWLLGTGDLRAAQDARSVSVFDHRGALIVRLAGVPAALPTRTRPEPGRYDRRPAFSSVWPARAGR